MITIKKIESVSKIGKNKTMKVNGKTIPFDSFEFSENELVLYIEKGCVLPEQFTKQYTLHRTKSKKTDDGFVLKEDVAIPLKLVFPVPPSIKDKETGKRTFIPLVEGDYDFSTLIGVKSERDTNNAKKISVNAQKDVQIEVLDEQKASKNDAEMEQPE